MTWQEVADGVASSLHGRHLVYVGTRGEDIATLGSFSPLTACVAVTATHGLPARLRRYDLERDVGIRVDLDTFSLDDDGQRGVASLGDCLRHESAGGVVFSYRPWRFVEATLLAVRDCRLLERDIGLNDLLEHKPWVEQWVARAGMPGLEWRSYRVDQRDEVRTLLASGPVVLRLGDGAGGVGLHLLHDGDDLYRHWPARTADGQVAVSRYRAGAMPVNVGGVVWADGVTVHGASVQLIGIPGCTRRTFGFCGNDLGAAKNLSTPQCEALEGLVRAVGNWLRAMGYRGAFGVDALVDGPEVLFVELNPRFQGSTRLVSEAALARGAPCLVLEHLAAHLGLPCPERRRLVEVTEAQPDLARLVVHNTADAPVVLEEADISQLLPNHAALTRMDTVLPTATKAEPGAVLAALVLKGPVTESGYSVSSEVQRCVQELTRAVRAPARGPRRAG